MHRLKKKDRIRDLPEMAYYIVQLYIAEAGSFKSLGVAGAHDSSTKNWDKGSSFYCPGLSFHCHPGPAPLLVQRRPAVLCSSGGTSKANAAEL